MLRNPFRGAGRTMQRDRVGTAVRRPLFQFKGDHVLRDKDFRINLLIFLFSMITATMYLQGGYERSGCPGRGMACPPAAGGRDRLLWGYVRLPGQGMSGCCGTEYLPATGQHTCFLREGISACCGTAYSSSAGRRICLPWGYVRLPWGHVRLLREGVSACRGTAYLFSAGRFRISAAEKRKCRRVAHSTTGLKTAICLYRR